MTDFLDDLDVDMGRMSIADEFPNDLLTTILALALDSGVEASCLRLVCKKFRGAVDDIYIARGKKRSLYASYRVCVSMEGYDVVEKRHLAAPIRLHIHHLEPAKRNTIDQDCRFHWVKAGRNFGIADISDAYPFSQFSWRVVLDPYNPESFGGPGVNQKVRVLSPDNYEIEGTISQWFESDTLVDFPLDHGDYKPDVNLPVVQYAQVREAKMGEWTSQIVRLLLPVWGAKDGQQFMSQSGTDWKAVPFHPVTHTEYEEYKTTLMGLGANIVVLDDDDNTKVYDVVLTASEQQRLGAISIDREIVNSQNKVPVTYVTKQTPFYMFM
eukprot:GFYU01000582.1.p1 GENE.GFYU01000582.1~~GFYU01000582.1.p1  ORF type:complete len:325 (+),score=113.67 GFYU01000582.1:269-1243(+)